MKNLKINWVRSTTNILNSNIKTTVEDVKVKHESQPSASEIHDFMNIVAERINKIEQLVQDHHGFTKTTINGITPVNEGNVGKVKDTITRGQLFSPISDSRSF